MDASRRLLNPYHYFEATCPNLWPRGMPLDFVNNKRRRVIDFVDDRPGNRLRVPAVQQFLADEDPDVDAM